MADIAIAQVLIKALSIQGNIFATKLPAQPTISTLKLEAQSTTENNPQQYGSLIIRPSQWFH